MHLPHSSSNFLTALRRFHADMELESSPGPVPSRQQHDKKLLIVGLPNSGKSTLFWRLIETLQKQQEPANFDVTTRQFPETGSEWTDREVLSIRTTTTTTPSSNGRRGNSNSVVTAETLTLSTHSALDTDESPTANLIRSTRLKEAGAVIFMVDLAPAAENSWIVAAKQLRALDLLLEKNVPILVLANRMECPGAVGDPRDFWDRLDCDGIVNRGKRPVGVFWCSLHQRRGYKEGLRWLGGQVGGLLSSFLL
ncbi:hypothetical protein V8F20_000243 [Naviculisporaceae sp. PSN 640]